MRETRPSQTAAWVATFRSLAAVLPDDAHIARDPFGVRFATGGARRLVGAALRHPRVAPGLLPYVPLAGRLVAYMQVRTRVLDDALVAFAGGGGRQVVLLGAGFDCRAARFALPDVTVFEVDHPATQARKRAVLPEAPGVRYVAWDFEHDPMDALPARLAEHGHDRTRLTLTLWEGVTMYLTPAAIEATVAAVGAYSAPGSPFAITYFDRERVVRPSRRARAVAAVVAYVGEPFRFGWDPAELPGWLAARGFSLREDLDTSELGAKLLPARWARLIRPGAGRIALAERAAA